MIDSLTRLVIRHQGISRLAGLLADLVFTDSPKTYRLITGPGRNLKFRLNARKQTYYLFGIYELDNINFLLARIRERAVFWDIGANIGYFGCIISARSPAAQVVCVEPSPGNIAALRENIAANGLRNVIVVEKALSSENKDALFVVSDSPCMGKIVTSTAGQIEPVINVPVTTIDTLVSGGLPWPDIIKVDAEGEEGLILKGAGEVLARRQASWFIEIHNPEAAGACWDILGSSGYAVYFLKGSTLLKAGKPQDIHNRCIWAEAIK